METSKGIDQTLETRSVVEDLFHFYPGQQSAKRIDAWASRLIDTPLRILRLAVIRYTDTESRLVYATLKAHIDAVLKQDAENMVDWEGSFDEPAGPLDCRPSSPWGVNDDGFRYAYACFFKLMRMRGHTVKHLKKKFTDIPYDVETLIESVTDEQAEVWLEKVKG